jgi:tetratricopeptide (TPR) repeat protein
MNRITILVILAVFFVTLNAQQESSYMMVMVQHKKSLNMARTITDFQSLAESYERIANAETDQWYPLYYAALCYINISIVTEKPENTDGYLDQAQDLIDRALVIYPDESELFVLQALLYQGRIRRDPSGRGMEYMMKAGAALDRAKSYNPENPRIYYLLGMNLLNLPEAAGGGVVSACPMFRTAIEKYRDEKPGHVLTPSWGGENNEQLHIRHCSRR